MQKSEDTTINKYMHHQKTSAFIILPSGAEAIARNRCHRKKSSVKICYVAEDIPDALEAPVLWAA